MDGAEVGRRRGREAQEHGRRLRFAFRAQHGSVCDEFEDDEELKTMVLEPEAVATGSNTRARIDLREDSQDIAVS